MHRQFAFDLLLAILAAPQALSTSFDSSSVVVNEIMYAPSAPEPEWVELLNRGKEPVNVGRWQISDATESKHLLPAGDIIVPPGGYLLLTKDSTVLQAVHGALPCAVVSVPGFPSLNNSGDAVVLADVQGHTMDSVVYRPEWGGSEGGRSLERRDADLLSMEPGNWGTCTHGDRSTPGRPNSIIRCSYDLSVVTAFFPAGVADTIIVIIRNSGKLPVNRFALLVYDDVNFDSIPAPGEQVGRLAIDGTLLPGDSLRMPLQVALSSGVHQLIAVADLPEDGRKSDNQARCTAMCAFARGSLLVNEIMADPGSGKSEYVELVNATDGGVDLKGWEVTDLSGSAGKILISGSTRVLHPGEFLVLAADSTLLDQFRVLANADQRLVAILHGRRLTLNNDADAVVVCDPLGVTIDSVRYSASWHNPDLSDHQGRSLERISTKVASNDPRNWGTCVDPAGGTPGMKNSISVGHLPVGARLSCAPNPFSPDADGIDDVIVIHYEMPLQTSIINVKIYDVRGRLIRRLASNEPGGPAGNIIWDGRDDSGAVARIGVYIAFLEAVTGAGAIESAKGILVLARKL
jgi:hypothetical protein